MPISPNQEIVLVPDDLLTSKSIGSCELLLFLQAEYGGLPIPLPHQAVVQILDLVRIIGKNERNLLPLAEQFQVTAFGLNDDHHTLIPTATKTIPTRASPTRRPPHHHPTAPVDGPFMPLPKHSHSLPSYDTATSPCAPCRMNPLACAPETDSGLQLRIHATTSTHQVVIPVAPEIDDERYHSVPQSPMSLLSVDGESYTGVTTTPPFRLPSPVSTYEVQVNVQTSTDSTSPTVNVQTILGPIPTSPHLTPTTDFGNLPVPAMAGSTPNSPRSFACSTPINDARVDALVAAYVCPGQY